MANNTPTPYHCWVFHKDKTRHPLEYKFMKSIYYLHKLLQKEGFDYLDAPIRRITAADAPLHYAPNLVAAALPDVAKTVKLVKEVMYQYK